MRADHVMDCEHIRKRFKNFFEDLLSDEEYEAFTSHLDHCETCRQFVRSLGDLSNQIWKLGNVKIPSDMADTALFKLQHPASLARRSDSQEKKRRIPALWIALAILGVMILLIQGITLLPKSPKVLPVEPKPKLITAPAEILDAEVASLSKSSGYSSFRPAVSSKKIAEEESMARVEKSRASSSASSLSLAGSSSEPISIGGVASPVLSKKSSIVSMALPSFHLHGVYSEAPIVLKLQEKKRLLQAELVSYARQAAQMKAAAEQSDRAAEPNPQDIEDAAKKLEKSSELFKEENLRIDSQLLRAGEDRAAKEIRHRQKIVECLRTAGAVLENQPTDVLVFSGSGDVLGRALQGIYPLFTGMGSIQDFTPKQKMDPYERQTVSLCLEKHGEPLLFHWHLAGDAEQQAAFFEILKELEGGVAYQNGKFSVCLVPKRELGRLRAKMQALRLGVTEYGSERTEGTVLTTAPSQVSVFFMEAG